MCRVYISGTGIRLPCAENDHPESSLSLPRLLRDRYERPLVDRIQPVISLVLATCQTTRSLPPIMDRLLLGLVRLKTIWAMSLLTTECRLANILHHASAA